MTLFPDGISLTFRDDGARYPVAKMLMAISVSDVERVAGATRQIAH
jgi:hypothetical protein